MASTRPAAVAGSFYPASADALGALLDDCFLTSRLGPRGTTQPSPSIVAGMVPHAGPIYSGPCAAHLYARLEASFRRIILLGVDHRGKGAKAALSPWSRWRTPLGEVDVDSELNESLSARIDFLESNAAPHAEEHSLEIQLPFLQRILADFQIVPISVSYISLEECQELGQAISEAFNAATAKNLKTLILASSDLSHYLSPRETEELDQIALERVLALDPAGLLEVVEKKNITMCGVLPTAAMLFAANALGVKRARLLKHCHSGDVTPMRQVVGYASVALES
ncbi:MAG TPA: AmmeMemoRadiSam system protein B [Candidatus Binatia bacterium]|nr:AmmeMemoRadiSam system protein B [Candidatus Binatia bacterium]